MQKLPEAPDRKWEWRMRKEKKPSRQKKESRSFSAMTNGVTTPKTFLQGVESAMCPSVDDAFANLSTSSSRLFY